MRFVLAIAAVAALTFTANAEPTFVSGGPINVGGLCNISTSGSDAMYGYVAPCPKPAAVAKKKKS